MKRFIFIILILVLGNSIQAQDKGFIVRDQHIIFHSDDYYDALTFGGNAVVLNTNGFYGPHILRNEDGSSKEYWYNKHYLDCYPASSIFLYSGTSLEYDCFFRYGVKSTTFTQQENHVSIRGQIDSLFFRSDYYCHRQLVISYYFVRRSDVQLFDNILDSSFSQFTSGYFYLVLLTSRPFSEDNTSIDTAYLLPSNAMKKYMSSKEKVPKTLFNNGHYRIPTKSGESFIDIIKSINGHAYVHKGKGEHSNLLVYIIPVKGFVFKILNEEVPCYLRPFKLWQDGRKTKEYRVLKNLPYDDLFI